jgi:hypothetical protein
MNGFFLAGSGLEKVALPTFLDCGAAASPSFLVLFEENAWYSNCI